MGGGVFSSPNSCLMFISMVRAIAVTEVSLGRFIKGSCRCSAVLSIRKKTIEIINSSGNSKTRGNLIQGNRQNSNEKIDCEMQKQPVGNGENGVFNPFYFPHRLAQPYQGSV